MTPREPEELTGLLIIITRIQYAVFHPFFFTDLPNQFRFVSPFNNSKHSWDNNARAIAASSSSTPCIAISILSSSVGITESIILLQRDSFVPIVQTLRRFALLCFALLSLHSFPGRTRRRRLQLELGGGGGGKILPGNYNDDFFPKTF